MIHLSVVKNKNNCQVPFQYKILLHKIPEGFRI